MPFAPDYSEYLRMKKLQKQIDVDSAVSTVKFRAPSAYGAYRPTYRIQYLPPNLFLPGRLYEEPSGGGGGGGGGGSGGGAGITIDFGGWDGSTIYSLSSEGNTAPLSFPAQSIVTYNLTNTTSGSYTNYNASFTIANTSSAIVTSIVIDGGSPISSPTVESKPDYATYTFNDVAIDIASSQLVITLSGDLTEFLDVYFDPIVTN